MGVGALAMWSAQASRLSYPSPLDESRAYMNLLHTEEGLIIDDHS